MIGVFCVMISVFFFCYDCFSFLTTGLSLVFHEWGEKRGGRYRYLNEGVVFVLFCSIVSWERWGGGRFTFVLFSFFFFFIATLCRSVVDISLNLIKCDLSYISYLSLFLRFILLYS